MVEDLILKIGKFQNSVKDASEKNILGGEIYWKMLKDEAKFILIGFEFRELESKNFQLNIGNNTRKVQMIRN